MTKRKTSFLDSFGEVLEDDALVDLIPVKKPSQPATAPPERRKSASVRRRKSFLETIGEALQEDPEGGTIPQKVITPREKKGFLDSLEGILKDNAFEEVMPLRNRNRKTNTTAKGPKVPEKPIQTTIESEILDKIRKVAEQKGIRVKDIINQALRRYVAAESS
jgi:uncharacterized protein (DUF4415 family)